MGFAKITEKNTVETEELYPKYQSGEIVGEFAYYEYDNKYILFGRKGRWKPIEGTWEISE